MPSRAEGAPERRSAANARRRATGEEWQQPIFSASRQRHASVQAKKCLRFGMVFARPAFMTPKPASARR